MNEYEIEQMSRENEALKKKLRKKQQETEETALYGFMAGRAGNGLTMYAASEMVDG